MNTNLSSEQIDFYRENGFLVLEDFLTDQELSDWSKVVNGAVEVRIRDLNASNNANNDKGYYNSVFLQCVNLWKTSDAVKELVLNPQLGKFVSNLKGVSGVRLYHDHALFKKPWANPTNWHVDNFGDPYSSNQSGMIWIALDDATLKNGCLYFLPGTHKEAKTVSRGTLGQAGIDNLFVDYPQWAEREPVAVEIKAGSAIYLHGLVAHAAGANMTPRPRRALSLIYMPEGATFNGNGPNSALPDEYIEQLCVGDVLEDDQYLPLVFSETVEIHNDSLHVTKNKK